MKQLNAVTAETQGDSVRSNIDAGSTISGVDFWERPCEHIYW